MIKVNDVFEAEGKDYITLDKIIFNGQEYIFTNELENDEPTKIFRVFRLKENGIVEVTDKGVLSQILPTFSKNMNDKLEVINESYAGLFN